jgi:hypothetical protein
MRKHMNTKSLSSASASFPLTAMAAALLLMAQPVGAQVDPDCTGSNPGMVTCTGTTFADGVTHTATGGDLTVNVEGGVTSFGTGGFNTTATGDNSITMVKGDGPNMLTNASGTTASAIIGATTENGDITITTGTGHVQGVAASTEYGIRAVSSGTGNVSIVTGANVNAGAFASSNSITGIEAITNGGAINIATSGTAQARQYGIRAHANGGDISVVTSGNNTIGGAQTAQYGIEAVTTGDISLVLGNARSSVTAGMGGVHTDTRGGSGSTTIDLFRSVGSTGLPVGILAETGSGALTINVNANDVDGTDVGVTQLITRGGAQGVINIADRAAVGTLDLSPDAGATITVNSQGAIGGTYSFPPSVSSFWGKGAGAGNVVVVNDRRMRGAVDFSGASGAVQIINNSDRPLGNPGNGGWQFGGVSLFGSGDDQIVNSQTATLRAEPGASMDFGAGDDKLINNGRFMVGVGFAPTGAITLSNLERLENNGLIIMGVLYGTNTDLGLKSNLEPGTRLIAHGVDFVAGPNSRIALDAALADTVQPDCSAAPAADCLDFTGGTTSGTTLLTLSDARPAVASAAFNEGMVLIEGASAAEHFVLDPNSRGYVEHTTTGPAIQKGLVTYRFTYDETAKQHKLTGVLADEGAQGGTFMASAQEIWRATTDTWFDRQAALRARPDQASSEAGLWSTVNMSTGERDFVAAHDIAGNSYDYNLKQDQQITHLAFGGDFINDGGLSFGGMAGYVYSTIDYDATKLRSEIGGFQAGLYGSYLAGPLSIDALVNYNLATQTLDAKNLGLGPDTQIRTDLTSIGGRVDAGWRLSFGDAFYLQPLLGVAYVTTTIDDLELPSGGGSFEFDGTSLRAGAGLRMGFELPTGGMKTSFDLTGRWWNEMDGENDTVVTIPNGNTEVPLTDEFNGGFSEVAAGVNLASAGSTGFSGFVNVKSKFASEYSTLGASAGFRYQW